MVGMLATICVIFGACFGAVGYQQYLLHHPDSAQEICTVSK